MGGAGKAARPPVRGCGSCQLCCRVFPVPEAGKLNTQWCRHLIKGTGCAIYEDRPSPCREFFCQWTRDEQLGEEWRPDIAGFVLSDPKPWALLVTNDPDRPQAWRQEPYQARIRAWARAAADDFQFAGVREGEKLMFILGDCEIDIDEDAAGPA